MRKQLPINVYTQINTDESTYLIQNISSDDLLIIVSANQPANNIDYDFRLAPGEGISNNIIEGTCWGKPESKTPLTVGVVEG